MRKTSHDGGDSTSITSGVENEFKKSAMKPKKTSLKRKPPNFSHDSDDTVIEPLLQKDKSETFQSAKTNTKGKTDTTIEKGNDKSKQLMDKAKTSSTPGFCGTTESLLSTKDYEVSKPTGVTAPLHNYMNTNMFHTHENSKTNSIVTTKSQILVEIDGTKQSGYNPSPLIFTTAKIHTDGKSKHMEPVQVTPVPILSTIEVSVSKGGGITTNEKKIGNGSSVVNSVYAHSLPYDKAKDDKVGKGINTPLSLNQDKIVDANANTFANKITSNTLMQNTNENILSSIMSKPLLTTSNSKDKPSTSKMDPSPIVITQPLFKSFNTDGPKNNVTVKAPNNLSETKPPESVKLKTEKMDAPSIPKTESTNKNKPAEGKFTNNIKTSESAINPNNSQSNNTKSTPSIGANKLLQRQKTLAEDTSTIETKIKENVKDLSAKEPSCTILSSSSKTIDNNIKTIDSKDDKSRKPSANIQNIETKSPVNTTAILTSASTSAKSSTTSSLSKPEISLKSSPLSNNVKTVSSTISSTSTTLANKNNTVNTTTVSSALIDHKPTSKLATEKVAEPAKTSSIATPLSNNVKTVSSTISSTSTTLANKNNAVNTTTVSSALIDHKPTSKLATEKVAEPAKTSSIATSVKTTSTTQESGKFVGPVKEPSVLITTSKVATTESSTMSTSKSAATKPTVATSMKTSTPSIKLPLDNTTKMSDSKQPTSTISTSVIKSPIVTTANTKSTTTSTTTKTPSVSSAQTNISPSGTTASINIPTKSPAVTSSGKQTTQSSKSAVPTTPPVKSTPIKSESSAGTKAGSTSSGSKTPVTTLTKTTATSSITTTVTKTTPNTKTTKESTGKGSASKTSTVTKASIPTTTATTKISSSVTVPVTTVTITKPSTTSNSKPVTSKTPNVTTKPPSSSSSNSITSDTSTKPKIVDTQTSTKKSESAASSSSSSTTPAERHTTKVSEPIKKSGSKSNESKTDGRVSKA